MKTYLLTVVISVFYLTSCSTQKNTATREYDDVYYKKSDKIIDQQPSITPPDDYSTAQKVVSGESDKRENDNQRFENNTSNNQQQNSQPDYSNSEQNDGNTYVTNNYYNEDDYYDYAYSSRLRRFYHPYGWGYYDTYYTNSYWYDYNPYSWGVSIYLGYNWWNPYTFSGPSYGFSGGYGYPGNYYEPWGSPFYNSYGMGYHQGYNNGYINGYYAGLYNGSFNPYYFNSYDSYSYYYGPRGRSSALNTTRNQQNISQLYANGTIRGDHSNTPVINQASNNEQPFIKIKQNSSLTNATNTGTIKGGDVKDPKSIKNGNTNDFNTPIKVNPNVISNDDHIIKTGHDVKVNDDNNSNAPIKVPSDIKGGNQVISNDNAPANNPTNIKVNHNVPDRNIRVNQQNDNSSVPVKTIRNENIQPSDGIIKNPKNQAPVRSNGNDYNPDNNLNNSNPNNNIRNIRNEPPVKQNDNNYNSAPVKNPRSSNGEINDQMPVKNERRKSDFLQHIKKVETSEPTRESNHSPSRNDRNNNQSAPQQPTAQPNQQQQRNNDGDNGGRIQTRPRR